MAEDRNTNDNQPRQPVNITPNQAVIGLNLENVLTQVKPGMLTYALNCQKANFDGNAVQYQNEHAATAGNHLLALGETTGHAHYVRADEAIAFDPDERMRRI